MLNGRKLQCPLPVSPVSPAYTGGFQKTEHGFAVTVSLDGEIFSEPFLMVVFDSLCKSCDVDGLCFTKVHCFSVDTYLHITFLFFKDFNIIPLHI